MAPNTDDNELWEQQPGETLPAFQAFAVYRDLGPTRSHRTVGQKLGKSIALMNRWSTTHQWTERIQAFEKVQDRIRLEATNTAIREMSVRHCQIAMAMQSKIVERLSTMKPDDLKGMKLLDVARVVDLAVKVERLSRGVATEITDERQETVKRLEQMTDEELDAYIAERERQLGSEGSEAA